MEMATIESGVGQGIPLIFLMSFGFVATCVLVIFVRRWTAAKQSGGPFTAPFHIERGCFTSMWRSVSKSVVFLLHQFAGFRLTPCVVDRVEAADMLSELNKRMAQRPCSSWGRVKPTMRFWSSCLKS